MKILLIVGILFLASCATPVTVMQKDNDTVTCGGGTTGSLAGGRLGYSIQKSHDRDCVEDYSSKGYKIIKSE